MSTLTTGPDRSPAPVAADALDALRDQVAGPVLDGTTAEAAAEAATFNVAVVHRPAVVVGATSAQDVAATVRWAAAQGLSVAAQATGHGPVHAVDGVLVTTRRMSAVVVDPQERTATFDAGTRWSDVLERSAPYGLAPLVGSSSGVGAVGYTLGGGMGLLARRHGFAADHVRSLQIVTADGVVRHVDADNEPDLFWAVRGGKGNFGVVTSMTVDLFPVATLWGGPVFYAADDARAVLHAFRTWSAALPDEATASVALMRFPPIEEVPEPLRGRFAVHLRYAHCGDPIEAERVLAPMLEVAAPVMSLLGPIPATGTDVVHQDPKDPMPVHEGSRLLAELPAEAVDLLLAVAGPQHDLPVPMVELRLMGGALARQAAVPNAVAGRGAAYCLFAVGVLAPGLEDVTPAVVSGITTAMSAWGTEETLVNFLGGADATPEGVQRAWAPAARERLLAVKQAYDPANLFRHGHALL